MARDLKRKEAEIESLKLARGKRATRGGEREGSDLDVFLIIAGVETDTHTHTHTHTHTNTNTGGRKERGRDRHF
jgi:hypothetical protein